MFRFVGIGNSISKSGLVARLGAIFVVTSLTFPGCATSERAQRESFEPTVTQSPSKPETEQSGPHAPELEISTGGYEATGLDILKYYIAAYNHGQAFGNPEPLERISHPDCRTCAKFMDQMRTANENNFSGGIPRLRLVRSSVDQVGDDQILIASLLLLDNHDLGANWMANDDGRAYSTTVLAQYDFDRWLIRAISIEEVEE